MDARVDAIPAAQLLARDPAGLVDPGRQRRARAIADLQHGASAAWGLAQIAAFWWLWRSGTGARIRDAMRRRTRSRTAQRAVFGAVLGALAALAGLPFALIGYRVAYSAGVTSEHVDHWLLDYLMRIVLDAALGAVIVTVVLWLVEHVRGWYLVVIAGLYGGALLSIALTPMLPFGTPHKTTPTAVAAVGARVSSALGVPGTPVVILATARRTNAMSAHAAGIGPSARALVGDVTLDHVTPPELRVAIGHADAQVRDGDILGRTLVAVTLLVFSAAIAVLLSDRVGFRRDDDALSRLALVATFLGLVALLAYPLYTASERYREERADQRVLETLVDPASMVRLMIRYADDDLVPLCDRRSIRWYFDERPSLGARIAAITGRGDPCPGGSAPRPAASQSARP